MIPVQPTCLWRYLSIQKRVNRRKIESRFYLSWEDGLWDIVRSYPITDGSTILVPSFFCLDVIKNIKSHGLVPKYYSLDDNLQPDVKMLQTQIKKENPKILVLFHAVGIQNRCVTKAFIRRLPGNLIIVEDAAHRMIDPKDLKLYRENYFCITSLRKVVPLQGSFVYARKHTLGKLIGPEKTFRYSSGVLLLWLFMQIALILQKYIPLKSISIACGKIAEYFMQKSYDLIGNNILPGYCPSIFARIYGAFDYMHIRNVKENQIRIYNKMIASEMKQDRSHFSIPTFSLLDFGNLRGYPIVLPSSTASKIIAFLRSNGILVKVELEGSPWTRSKTIIYLSLGLHVETRDITTISKIFLLSVKRFEKSPHRL
ncbi:hypothetical protein HYW55_04040 [Candidatus Gottesmanbacteria bacterium]|nr:hypothetical protein [Candidatus Gottesmanbacteria bacterium]